MLSAALHVELTSCNAAKYVSNDTVVDVFELVLIVIAYLCVVKTSLTPFADLLFGQFLITLILGLFPLFILIDEVDVFELLM